MDRLLFLSSRFLWPVHNLLVVAAIGIAFGQRGLADYTYALALSAPFYFLVGYSFPMFLLIDSERGDNKSALAFIRLVSALGTIPLVLAVSWLVPSTQGSVVVAVWIVKVAELLFEPLPAVIAAETGDTHRGQRLFVLDLSRVALAQALLWYAVLGAGWDIVRTLVVMGACGVLLSTALLVTIPSWRHSSPFGAEIRDSLRRLFSRATPMTISGALLALLVSTPRLVAEPSLSDQEGAIFGTAQVLGTGAAVLFHSLWLYELHRIRSDLVSMKLWRAVKTNTILSAIFATALALGAVVLVLAQAPLLGLLKISAAPSALLPVLFVSLGLQHCVSVHRDFLKFTGQQWREALIVILALAAATVTYCLFVYALGFQWLVGVISMCIAASALQVTLSIVWLQHLDQRADLEVPLRTG